MIAREVSGDHVGINCAHASAYVPFAGDLKEVLCIRESRVVSHNNCVRYRGLTLQIPEQRHRRHFVKATVMVHDYPDGSLALFHGPRLLARFKVDGSVLEHQERVAA